MTFEPLSSSPEKIAEMSRMATAILREHYDPIVGKAQNDYMLVVNQSETAIRGQLAKGYRYFFVKEGERTLGFLAFFPRGGAMYLSKFYLYKKERGKGYAREMLAFVTRAARAEGLAAVELNVNRHNETTRIYERLGFTRLREERIDIGGGFFIDDYVYRLPFSE